MPLLLWLLFRKTAFHDLDQGLICLPRSGILTGNGFGAVQLNFGQALTLLGSIAIALEIIFISHFAPKVNTRRVTVLQLILPRYFVF